MILNLSSLPPQPDLVHPYPMQEHFTGRVRERQMLTEWLTSAQRPVLALIAIGGMGKSALTWAWLQRDVLGLPLPGLPHDQPEVAEACHVLEAARPEGVLWWSFYEQGARFAAFLDESLTYASSGVVNPRDIPSTYEKVRALITMLQQHRFLLVLDGFERELRAYASLAVAYQGNTVTEDMQDDFRTCIDPRMADFLRWVAALPLRSRVLLTSRFFPRELDGLMGCQREDLTGLAPEDAVAFFRAQGVCKGTSAEIQAACAPYGYHPLALRLLSGMIVHDPSGPGDVTVVAAYSPIPDLVSREHHILSLAYDALLPQWRELLSRLAAIRSPVNYETAVSIFCRPWRGRGLSGLLKKLLGQEEPALISERDFKVVTRELVDCGLLLFDREGRRYDLHPIVRGYAYGRLTDKVGVHTRLWDYFAAIPGPKGASVRSVDDLAPVIELYYHIVGAGQYAQAMRLFDWLYNLLFYRLGAFQTCIELLCVLFPDSEARPRRLKRVVNPTQVLNALANTYGLSGQPRRAAQLLEAANALDEKKRGGKMKLNLAIGLGNLAVENTVLGELVMAERNLRRQIELCQGILLRRRLLAYWGHAMVVKAWGHAELGRLLTYRGTFDEAEPHLITAQRAFDEMPPGRTTYVSLVRSYRALHALLMEDVETALGAARWALELWERLAEIKFNVERDRIWAGWLLGTASVALALQERERQNQLLEEAEGHLTEALTRCRYINLVEREPDILLAWAHWHWAKGNAHQAQEYAEEALALADRCEYRLVQAEAHNFLAQWELHSGDVAEARKHAEIAKERAWCDGPPYCYKPALEKAKRLLEEAEQPRER